MALRHKLTLAFGLLFTTLIVAFWLALKFQLQQTLTQQTDTLGEILARQTADSVTELVLANDLLGLNVVLNQLATQPGVMKVSVSDVDGVILDSATKPAYNSQASGRRYQAAITLQEAVAGMIVLELDETLLSNPLARPHTIFYAGVALSLALTALLAWTFGNQISQSLRRAIELAESTEEDDLTEILESEPAEDDDIGLLQYRMAELMRSKMALKQQIIDTGLPAPDEEETAELRAERRMSTVLLVEVSGSNTAIELLHPATLSTLLQQFQFYLRQSARLYRGVVSRINGNGAMLTFDTRHCQNEHSYNAICCGQLFLRVMREVAAIHKQEHAQSLEFRLAVHSGDVYYSPIWQRRKNGKSRPREESAIGKTVDLSLALLAHASNSKLLVSELSFDLAGGQQKFPAEETSEFSLGTDNLQLMTYSLGANDGIHGELLDRQARHLHPARAE